MLRRLFLLGVLVLALPAPAAAKPNIVFILTDDQRADTMRMMPVTRAAFGVDFNDFVVTTPNCCPSRATFLTGRYVHNTGVFNSTTGYQAFKPLEPDSLAPWLQAEGYRTGFVGKYFNGFDRDDPLPPGWDEFYARLYGPDRGNGTTTFALRENGPVGNAVVQYPNAETPEPYATRVFGAKARAFIRRSLDPSFNPDGKPFALFLWTTAVNTGPPEETYQDAPLPRWKRPPSFLEADMSDKPSEVARSADVILDPGYHRRVRASQLRQLPTVDDVVAGLLELLDDTGARSDTVGIFASDNGRFWGEHGLRGKVLAYEESIRVPFRMMIPGQPATTIGAQVANIDVAPTIMELVGSASNHAFNGESFLPLIAAPETDWRPIVLLEHLSGKRYDALRTWRWTYVEWPKSGHVELYDRVHDPFQLENVAGEKRRVVRVLGSRLSDLTTE